jgi:Tfp pilus assembly protein PilN
MICINLLPVRAQKKRSSSLIQMAAMVGAVAVTLVIGVGVHHHFAGVATEQEQLVEQGQKEINSLKRVIGEVNQFDK